MLYKSLREVYFSEHTLKTFLLMNLFIYSD